MKIIEVNCETGETVERDMTADEIAEREADGLAIAWSELRRERNGFLSASDWTVLGDSPTSTAAWKTYRQALRDLPANTTDPFNVVWPTPPA
jgi:hypothetical protein